jgi:23S rRNA pseudouridine1911/1915/1917 synthase
MSKFLYTIPFDLDKQRLDKAIALLCTDFSRSQVQKAIKNKQVLLNNNIVEVMSSKVSTDDILEITFAENKPHQMQATQIDLDIVYEDDHLIVLNKAAGITTHPGVGNHDDTLVNALLYHTQKLSDVNGEFRAGIVHRLDKETSGLMVIAKTNQAHNNLAKQLQDRDLKRRYLALIWGVMKPLGGTIDMPITRSNRDRTRMTTVQHGGKSAVTHYETKEILAKAAVSLVECRLETGRTHQIRVHFSQNRHSVVGDQVYGHNERKVQSCPQGLKEILGAMKRQALHSYYIGFMHPITEEFMEFTRDVPQDYQELLEALRG